MLQLLAITIQMIFASMNHRALVDVNVVKTMWKLIPESQAYLEKMFGGDRWVPDPIHASKDVPHSLVILRQSCVRVAIYHRITTLLPARVGVSTVARSDIGRGGGQKGAVGLARVYAVY